MLENPTASARKVVARAQLEASAMGHDKVETVHLLLGLVQDQDGMAGTALADAGISLQAVRDAVRERLGSDAQPSPEAPLEFSAAARKTLETSLKVAFGMGADEVSSEHLLVATVRRRDDDVGQVLIQIGADPDSVRVQINRRAFPARDRRQSQGGMVGGRVMGISQTPWSPDAPIEPDSPERFTR